MITRLWAALSRLADAVEGYGAPHTEGDRRQLKRLREALEKRFPVQPRGRPELAVRSAAAIVRVLDLSRLADLQWAARFLLIYFTGMRCGETAANTLRLSDLSVCMVAGKVDNIMVESGNTKARKKTAEPELKFIFPRAAPLDPVGVLVRYLYAHHKYALAPGPLAVRGTVGDVPVFPGLSGRGVNSTAAFSGRLVALARSAGVPHADESTSHCLRASFATRMQNAGVIKEDASNCVEWGTGSSSAALDSLTRYTRRSHKLSLWRRVTAVEAFLASQADA